MDQRTKLLAGSIIKLQRRGAERNIRRIINKTHDADVASVLEVLDTEARISVFQLISDPERQAEILRAEGDRQAAILNAEGFSNALDKIYGVAKNVDAKTMSLQYFETLKQLGSSPSTKFIFPMEFTNLLTSFTKMASDRRSADDA